MGRRRRNHQRKASFGLIEVQPVTGMRLAEPAEFAPLGRRHHRPAGEIAGGISVPEVAKDDIIGIVAHRIGDAAVIRSDHQIDLRSDHIRRRKLAKSLGFQG